MNSQRDSRVVTLPSVGTAGQRATSLLASHRVLRNTYLLLAARS